MTTFLSREVQEGLNAARKRAQHRKSRLRVHAGDEIFRVLRSWDDGFAMDLDVAPKLRGLVDLYDGSRHLYQCLIVASSEEDHEMIYEFKRHTAASDTPPVDFALDENAPVALITQAPEQG